MSTKHRLDFAFSRESKRESACALLEPPHGWLSAVFSGRLDTSLRPDILFVQDAAQSASPPDGGASWPWWSFNVSSWPGHDCAVTSVEKRKKKKKR